METLDCKFFNNPDEFHSWKAEEERYSLVEVESIQHAPTEYMTEEFLPGNWSHTPNKVRNVFPNRILVTFKLLPKV